MDLATPAPKDSATVDVEIVGHASSVTAGSSILRDARQTGVVHTTVDNPEIGANVVTTEYSDRATNCPEYRVTTVPVAPASHCSKRQDGLEARATPQGDVIETT